MKVGDLVKYRHYHNNLQDLMGIVLRVDRAKERAKGSSFRFCDWGGPYSHTLLLLHGDMPIYPMDTCDPVHT